jgi:hypothetical protein
MSDQEQQEAAVFCGTDSIHPRRCRISLSDSQVSGEKAERTARCPSCRERKPISAFARDGSKSSGHKSHCKGCDNAKSRAYYEANRERVIARVQESQRRAKGQS